jgi:hypothetical protein
MKLAFFDDFKVGVVAGWHGRASCSTILGGANKIPDRNSKNRSAVTM